MMQENATLGGHLDRIGANGLRGAGGVPVPYPALPDSPRVEPMCCLRPGAAVEVGRFQVVGTGAPAAQATRVSLCWAGEALRVAFGCIDRAIIAEQEGRDNIKSITWT